MPQLAEIYPRLKKSRSLAGAGILHSLARKRHPDARSPADSSIFLALDRFLTVEVLLRSLSLLIITSNLSQAAGPICKIGTITQNPKYVAIKKEIDQLIFKFAQSPKVATQADAILTKLIAQKSLAIAEWMTNHHLQKKSETEIVREWRVYYAKTFVLSKYPNPDPQVSAQIGELMDKSYRLALDSQALKKFDSLFEKAKELALKRIAAWKMDDGIANSLKQRVGAIQLVKMTDFKTSKFTAAPLEILSWGVAYDPGPNEINLGVDALKYPNDASIVAVLIHEIGHSFDPCRWTAYIHGDPIFSKVVACLRSDESVGARRRDDSQLEEFKKSGRISPDLFAALKSNLECNKAAYPPIGVQADQSAESFADWFAAEAISSTEFAKPELRADLCVQNELQPGSSYPTNDRRLNRIYRAQPQIAAKLGIKVEKSIRYCAF